MAQIRAALESTGLFPLPVVNLALGFAIVGVTFALYLRSPLAAVVFGVVFFVGPSIGGGAVWWARGLNSQMTRAANQDLSADGAPLMKMAGIAEPSAMPASLVADSRSGWVNKDAVDPDLVSVIMPVFNAAAFVAEAVESVLGSYGVEVELIIIDDGSTDASMEILERYAAKDSRIFLIQSHRNHGPYFCRNVGLMAARGRYVAFHDSDDRSNPERLVRQLQVLKERKALVSICHAARWRSDWSEALSEPRFASVTMMFERALINEVGFFDSVRWGGDSEYLSRIRAVKGRDSVEIMELELYSLRWHSDCLTAGDAHRAYSERGGRLNLDLSPARKAYENAFVWWHHSEARPFIDFPLRERPFPISREQSSSFFEDLSFRGGMATHPPRESVVRSAIASVSRFLDSIDVYFNGYASPPNWVSEFANVNSHLGPDLQDAGKFDALNGKSGIWFTLDDDISYPVDYVRHMVIQLALAAPKTVVGVHGINFSNPRDFLEGREVFHFREAHIGSSVDALGTGTTVFDSRDFAPAASDFPRKGFCDLYFAGMVHIQEGRLFCVPRRRGWLAELTKPGPESLWVQTVSDRGLAQKVFEESGLSMLYGGRRKPQGAG